MGRLDKKEREDLDKIEKNLGLLIKIILYILLALAFLNFTYIERYTFEGRVPTIDPYFILIFLLGIFIVFFSYFIFIQYSPRNKKLIKLFVYPLGLLFVILIFVSLLHELNFSLCVDLTQSNSPSNCNFLKSFFKPFLIEDILTSLTFLSTCFLFLFITFIVLLILKVRRIKIELY